MYNFIDSYSDKNNKKNYILDGLILDNLAGYCW